MSGQVSKGYNGVGKSRERRAEEGGAGLGSAPGVGGQTDAAE